MDNFYSVILSDREIKFVALSKKGDSYKLERAEKKDLPGGLVSDFEIVDQKTFVSTLRDFFFNSSSKIELESIVIGLPVSKSYLKVSKLPQETESLRDVIVHKVTSNSSITSESGYFDWRKKGEEVQVAAVEKKIIDNWEFSFKMAALKIAGIKPLPLALVNLLPQDDDLNIIIFSDQEQAQFVIGKRGLVYEAKSTIVEDNFEKSAPKIFNEAKTFITTFEGETTLKIKKIFLRTPDNAKLSQLFEKENFLTSELPLPLMLEKEKEDFFAPIALAIYQSIDPKGDEISFPPEEKPIIEEKIAESIQEVKNGGFKFMKIIKFLLIILILVGISGGGVFLFKTYGSNLPFIGKSEEKNESTLIENITDEEPQATESAQASSSADASESAKAENKAEFKIRVLNGNGVQGDGAKAKIFLTEKGWKVVSTANASTMDYETTQIRFKESAETQKEAIVSDLESKYKVTVGNNLEEDDTVDIEVIIGIT